MKLDFSLCAESSWERLERSGKPVVIYGMGNGADAVMDELNALGVQVSGVAASDGFVRGQSFRGFKVKKVSELGGDCIVAVAFASSLPEVMGGINALAQRLEVVVPCVPVTGGKIFNRVFAEKHGEELNRAYALMADGESRRVFEGYVNFELGGELTVLKAIESHKDEAFNSILRLNNENYLDVGAYRGDTVDELLRYSGGVYRSIIAAEPDRKSFAKLCEHIAGMANCAAVNAAVADVCGEMPFCGKAGRQSALGEGGESVAVTTVDELAKSTPFSFIKVDSEGAEARVLRGGAKTLRELKPKLNIAAYHRAEDIFRLPLLISEINPGYRIYLRHHPYIPAFDTNFYCI